MFWRLIVAMVLGALGSGAAPADQDSDPGFRLRTLRGQVVYVGDAMERLHGVKLVSEARQRVLVLETDAGDLHPLVEDVRGRAFRRDERLRKLDVELLARQHDGSPFLQIVKIFEVDGEQRLEIDYWCEICSIAMFELKPCDCCQQDIILRKRPVDAKK